MNKEHKEPNTEAQFALHIVMWRYLISRITMKRIKLFTPTMSGNIYIYEDYYKQKWLAYPDFPRMRCRHNAT